MLLYSVVRHRSATCSENETYDTGAQHVCNFAQRKTSVLLGVLRLCNGRAAVKGWEIPVAGVASDDARG